MKQEKMIAVVVKKEFLDKYTGQKRKVGEKMSVTYKRLAEIRRYSNDYVEVVKETTEVAKEVK